MSRNNKIVPLIVLILMVLSVYGAVGTTVVKESDSTDLSNFSERYISHPRVLDKVTRGLGLLGIESRPDETIDEITISSNLPDGFDWRDYQGKNWMTSIRDQGGCGSCWAFATMGVLEALLNIESNNPNRNIDLSEQYLVSCATYEYGCQGCEGAYLNNHKNWFQWTKENEVIPENCFPYSATEENCDNKCPDYKDQKLGVYNWGWVPCDKNQIKQYLIDKGPLSVTMAVYSDFYYEYPNHMEWEDDVYFYKQGAQVGHHAITLVGYKDDENIKNGGYWICKNSWGTNWGLNGWFKIAYDECGIQCNAVHLSVEPSSVMTADAGEQYFGIKNEEISFSGQANGGTPPYNYHWDFGDGNTAQGQNPKHIYTDKGEYTAILTATDHYGNNVEDTANVRVSQSSVDLEIMIHRIKKIDNIENPLQGEADWAYRVSVKNENEWKDITNEYCTDDDDHTEDVSHLFLVSTNKPEFKIKVMERNPILDKLADISSFQGGGFDYGIPELRGAIFHCKYDVIKNKLIEIDNFTPEDIYFTSSGENDHSSGDENDAKIWFKISDNYISPSDAKISYTPQSAQHSTRFYGSVKDGIAPFSWSWDFGDGHTSTGQNLLHLYDKPGKYTVKLSIEDKFGKTTNIETTVEIVENQPPYKSYIDGPSSGIQDIEYSFVFKAFDPETDELRYKINWGDGKQTSWTNLLSSGTKITKNHIWYRPGDYTITFYAQDKFGKSSQTSFNVNINQGKSKNKIINSFYMKSKDQFPILLDILQKFLHEIDCVY